MIKDTVPGVVGNCASTSAWVTAWITLHSEPVLHIMSVVAGIIASIATAAYYILEYRRARKERTRDDELKQAKRRRAQRKKVR